MIEAGEDVEPVARGDAGNVVDEVASSGSEAEAGRLGPEFGDPSIEARLPLERGRG